MQEKKHIELPDIMKIMELLPHRYPFLLVDRIIEIEDDKRIVGIKNVTVNEPYFVGHFPGQPIMPGVLLIEAMAQVGAVVILSKPEFAGKILFLAGVEKARFRRPVVPGDQLRIEMIIGGLRQNIGVGHGIVSVGDEIAAEADIKFAIQR